MRPRYLLIAAFVLALDQITKWMLTERLALDAMVPIFPGWFNLVHVGNTGIAFGFLSDLPQPVSFALIIATSALALGIIVYLLWKSGVSDPRLALALSLILGGAVGNLVDRLLRGRVTDFLDFYYGSYHWPAFNVADSAIVVGAGLLMLEIFWPRAANAPAGKQEPEVRQVEN